MIKKKKAMENKCSLYDFFCSINNKKRGKTPFFLFSKKCHFENTKNKKNKKQLSQPNKFLVFFIFKSRKQLLKTSTKQALTLHIDSHQPSSKPS